MMNDEAIRAYASNNADTALLFKILTRLESIESLLNKNEQPAPQPQERINTSKARKNPGRTPRRGE
jgi:hypothetical protein